MGQGFRVCNCPEIDLKRGGEHEGFKSTVGRSKTETWDGGVMRALAKAMLAITRIADDYEPAQTAFGEVGAIASLVKAGASGPCHPRM